MIVVPRRTSHTPENAWVGGPGLFGAAQNIEVSVVFTWDIPEAQRIVGEWRDRGCPVKIGGPAFDDPGGEFVPGRFVRDGITITSRGCPKNCPWCYVPKREGKLRTLTIHTGNTVQDNNLLACPRKHIESVFEMLRGQKAINFRGGLDADFLQEWHIEAIRSLSVHEVWLAYDAEDNRKTLTAIEQFAKAGFRQRQIRCYCLVGFRDDTINKAEGRCREVFNRGGLPFAQVFDGTADPTKDWRRLARTWQRPAATFAHMKSELHEKQQEGER